MISLRQKTIIALYWSYLDSFGSYVLKFGFGIAIARALSPEDYGIMGMIVIFLGIAGTLSESGFGMALIQKKDADQKDYSTVFWFNLFVASVCYGILFFSAPAIARFYNQPILVIITRITALSIILDALSIIHYTILSQKLDFKKQTIIRFISTLTTGIVGVVLAYNGFAIWALVVQSLVANVINTFGIWFLHKWRPGLVFSLNSFRVLYRYGYKILLSGMSDLIFTKIYYPLIGKYFPAAQLGFYTKANGFYDLLVRQTTIAYGRVTFPVFSSIQDQKERFIKNYLRIYNLLAFMMFPLTLFAIISARPLIGFLLTEKWLPAVPLMQVFFLEGFFFSLYMLNVNTFNALGQSGFPLKLEIIKKALIVTSIFIAFQFGIKALIIGQVLSSFIVFFVVTIKIKDLIDIILLFQIKKLMPVCLISLICYFIDLLLIEKFLENILLLNLFAKLILLPFLYIFLSHAFNKDVMDEFLMIFKKIIPFKLKILLNLV